MLMFFDSTNAVHERFAAKHPVQTRGREQTLLVPLPEIEEMAENEEK
jgi:hypothetical protein